MLNPNRPIFAGEILGSLFVLGQQCMSSLEITTSERMRAFGELKLCFQHRLQDKL